MKFTVVWRPSAERRLAELWTEAHDRDAIASAADEIDHRLRRDPLSVGESRSGMSRILLLQPLAVYYDVDEADRRVFVWSVWRTA